MLARQGAILFSVIKSRVILILARRTLFLMVSVYKQDQEGVSFLFY